MKINVLMICKNSLKE